MTKEAKEIIESPKTIVEFNEFEAKLTIFKNKFGSLVYDLDDPEQFEQAKEDKKEILKAIKGLDAAHKVKKADVLEESKFIDGERKRIKDIFIEGKDNITGQFDKHANIAVIHAEMLHQKVEDITNLSVFDDLINITIQDVKDRLKSLSEVVIDKSYESREADAHMAKVKAGELLEGKILYYEKQIKDEKLEKLSQAKAQKEREDKIRKDASEKADKEKLAAQEREKQAEADKKAAEIKAKKDAEDAKKQAEADKKAAVAAEQKRLNDIAEKEALELKAKESNKKNRAKKHGEAKDSLIAGGIDKDVAVKVITLIKNGDVKNIKIEY